MMMMTSYKLDMDDSDYRTVFWDKVDGLCGKLIVRFGATRDHLVALTTSGAMFYWKRDQERPKLWQVTQPNCSRIVDIACTDFHVLGLTVDGKLLAWINDEEQKSGKKFRMEPRILMSDVVKMEASGETTAVVKNEGQEQVLLVCGAIYARGEETCRWTTVKPPVSNDSIEKLVIANETRVLFITKHGHLRYVERDYHRRVNLNMCFSDIAAAKYEPVLGALAYNGDVYKLEFPTSGPLGSPTLTNFRTLDSLIATECLSSCRNMVVKPSGRNYDLWRGFNNSGNSDVEFLVEGRVIYAHKSVLRLRSMYFDTMFSGVWKEGGGRVEISDHRYDVYHAFIRYIYTDDISRALASDVILDLLRLAHQVMMTPLITVCSDALKRHLSCDNVIDVYDVGRRLDVRDLLEACYQFGKANMILIFKTSAFARADAELAREFVCYIMDNDELTSYSGPPSTTGRTSVSSDVIRPSTSGSIGNSDDGAAQPLVPGNPGEGVANRNPRSRQQRRRITSRSDQ